MTTLFNNGKIIFEIIFQSEQARARIQFTTNWFTFTQKKMAGK